MIEQQIFNNRYRLDGKLGEGGMAVVYSGTDTVLRRRVAVKVLRQQYAADAEFVRRFYQEAESAAKLSHPNIVNTYDVGRQGETYYIVMELIDGSSLAEIIAQGALPEPVAIDYAAQICSGLAYAHRAGLLHRDIKPANILVTKDDVLKLSDFGIARAVSQETLALTKPGVVMGSVFYSSPEQAQGHELTDASDLYSVGIVLYQMLTGQLPYTGESPVTVALRHIGDPVPRIDPESGVSPAVAAIVNRLLQKLPEHRFQSASEVASALREARERPAQAAFPLRDDAPTALLGHDPTQPPPRRSPLPDRSYTSLGDDEERRSRAGGRFVGWLVALLVLAMIAGYVIFGRSFPSAAVGVTVGNYAGMTDVAAQQAVVNAGLSARFIRTASDTVPANRVIRQNPAPGGVIAPNSLVELVVSNGLPLVGLRDVRGFVVADATKDLVYDRFKVRVVQRYDSAPKGSVIDQSPKPGSQVPQGTTITLVVSKGPKATLMPNLVELSLAKAQSVAQKDGFSLVVAGQQPSTGAPAGTILSQDVMPGVPVSRSGTTVHVVVSAAAAGPPATIPDVGGRPLNSALGALSAAGFVPDVTYSVQADENGTIVGETPAGGTQAPTGSTVGVVLSVPGAVPDTEGMSVADAQARLQAAGYTPGPLQYTTKVGADGKVVGTDPEVGTTLAPGSAVTLIVNGP
ncbi:MAG: Stk1 family PASTA domain-containing Ser/Thr kinase [Vulcanimicrobiaceae bacterium]